MIIEVVKGGSPLTNDERNKIRAIFKESNCPNESLKNSLKGFVKLDGRILHIDYHDGNKYAYPEEMEV
ncbi:hypothetical protein [Anaerosinus massiliensis]|uniref:hypothetical protein n=1 Tax=Massilibacillus massiliensis TaxID=1806837 RepID=UPI000DA61486|nr:hypothetical protein [Massilibacillus massiliensis]